MWKEQLEAMKKVDVRIDQLRTLLEELEDLEKDLPVPIPWPGMIAGLLEERDVAIKAAERDRRSAKHSIEIAEMKDDEIVRLRSLISAIKITEDSKMDDVARRAIKLFSLRVDGDIDQVTSFGKDLIPGYEA